MLRYRQMGAAACAALALLLAGIAGGQELPERRRDQFPTEPGYLVVPAPYSLPGIGEGIFAIGYFSNVWRTPTDAYAYWITGDAKGFGAGINEIHLVRKALLLDVFREQIDRAQVFQYSSRGMDTRRNDYQLVDVSDVVSLGGALTLALLDRHLELVYEYFSQDVDLERFRDRKGHIVRELDEPIQVESEQHTIAIRLDNTDDRWDPRRGVRAALAAAQSPPQERAAPDFYVINATVDLYVPFGKQSTWAIDLFHSEAVVREQGETDPAVLVRDICPVSDPQCEGSPVAQDYLANTIAENSNGTAVSLGGRDRLRGYPQGRFQGAYAEYVGTELRLNLTDEMTPFDYFFWKDVRTNLQLALIGEVGTVAESADELWERSRGDYGAGFRMVTAGGGVYRADFVTGDEGPQITIIVNYPW